LRRPQPGDYPKFVLLRALKALELRPSWRIGIPIALPDITKGTNMNKSELIDVIAEEAGLTKADAAKALDAVTGAIVGAVASGDSVSLIGFGTFKASARAAREGKNPKTGEKLSIAATTVPKFSAGTNFKAAVAQK
jgi:DNA-binding protein HU-beta